MDARMAKAWYGGAWYETPNGGVHPQNDPANPQASGPVDEIHDLLAQEITPGIRTLDLGCCAGRFTFAMDKMGAVATGLDCVEYPLEYARRLANQWGSNATFVEASFHDLPLGPNSFDLVLFPNNIVDCSYPEFEHLLAQLGRILAPAGKLCIEMADGLQRAVDRKKLPQGYDPLSGICHGTNQALGHTMVPQDTCFWTPGFAIHLARRWFSLVKHAQTPGGATWLVFRRPG
ncbi:MAG: class I SAM-dependent methyltransferase [Candidatus Sulfotelmatobacter sp.]